MEKAEGKAKIKESHPNSVSWSDFSDCLLLLTCSLISLLGCCPPVSPQKRGFCPRWGTKGRSQWGGKIWAWLWIGEEESHFRIVSSVQIWMCFILWGSLVLCSFYKWRNGGLEWWSCLSELTQPVFWLWCYSLSAALPPGLHSILRMCLESLMILDFF